MMIKVPSVPSTDAAAAAVTAGGAGKKIKSLNAPITSKVQLLQGLVMNDVKSEYLCFECRKPMTDVDHYKWVL